MAIATDITVDILINDVKVDEYELSDTLDNYTIEEVQAAAYCGQYNIARRNNCLRTYDYGWVGAFDKDNGVFQYPFKVERTGGTYTWETGATGYNAPDGLYGGTVWLSAENSTFDSVITDQNASNYRLVTKWNVNKFIFTLPALSGAYGQVSSVTWEQKPYPACYIPEGWGTMTYHTAKGMPYDQTADVSLRPYNIFVFEEKFFLIANKVEAGFIYNSTQEVGNPKVFGDSGHYSYDRSTTIATSYNADYESPIAKSGGGYNQDFGLSTYPTGNRIPFQWQGPGGYQIWYQAAGEDVQNYICFWDHSGYATNGGYIRMSFYFCKVDDVLHYFANMGVYFYTDKLYKPIIEDTIVTGYTDDLSTASDIDDWDGSSIHDVPITPPAPPPTPGYDDDPWSGVSFSGVGVGGAGAFAKCYYMTSTELANLRSWMNSNNVPEGFDPMQQIIGLSQVPVSLSGDDNTTVQFVNSSAVYDPGVTRVVDSGVNTQISMGTPKKYSLGSVDIVRRMQERGEPYLDYDCQIELYLPLIGMFSLDTQAVMGRTITAEAVLDPISGTLAAYAYVAKDGQNLPIAYGSTTIGVDLPISAQQYSVSRAALKQANAQLGASILSSTLSFIAAATAGGKGSGTGAKTATGTNNGLAAAGIREAGADYMKASQVGNIFGDFMNWGRTVRQLSYGNNTAIAGSFGGSTAQWAYPFTPYVKIIRPRYEKPANYNHSQGVPCVQTKTIGSCTGFIQCLGVDVSGISGATDLELQAIQAALSNGIYAGGSQS